MRQASSSCQLSLRWAAVLRSLLVLNLFMCLLLHNNYYFGILPVLLHFNKLKPTKIKICLSKFRWLMLSLLELLANIIIGLLSHLKYRPVIQKTTHSLHFIKQQIVPKNKITLFSHLMRFLNNFNKTNEF